VNEFVEECRREWKRLGVPDHVAAEMVADLEADLDEAEAEGASAEEVLGSGASDARTFASAWAVERGVVGRAPRSRRRVLRRSRLLAALATCALAVAIAGAVLVIAASPSAQRRGGVWIASPPPPSSAPVTMRVIGPEVVAGDLVVGVDDGSADTRTLGAILLIVGLAGIAPLTMISLWRE
jgi:hypothetical protein